jgi:hypothetical protein
MANNQRSELRQEHEFVVYMIQQMNHIVSHYEQRKIVLEAKIKEIDDKGEGYV